MQNTEAHGKFTSSDKGKQATSGVEGSGHVA